MYRFFFCLIFCFHCLGSTAQVNYRYEELIAKAGLFHLQKSAKEAIRYYDTAFTLQQPDALTAYKAAGVYALDRNSNEAFGFLEKALAAGWTESGLLDTDPYFDYLKHANPGRWNELKKKALHLENVYAQTLKMPALRRQINQLGITDQQLRYKRIQASEEERARIDDALRIADSVNRKTAKYILGKYGWPSVSEIGKDGQNNFWLLIQHADDDVLFQRAALVAMSKLKTSERQAENYAFLYDRIQCNLNYKQLYGTQVNWTQHGEASGYRLIEDESRVDERRKQLGLLPLRIYALTYGFNYKEISVAEAKENEVSEQAAVNRLLDSASYYLNRKVYQQVYDLYNQASMVPGGMSDTQQLEAAKIFAKIAATDTDPQYPSIALDFLFLLSLRGSLIPQDLDTGFDTLKKEARWVVLQKEMHP